MDNAAAEIRSQVSDAEWDLRVDLAACYRLVALYGWDDLIFTHIFGRVPGPNHHFLINPYGLLFDEITASSLVKVDIDGRTSTAPTTSTPPDSRSKVRSTRRAKMRSVSSISTAATASPWRRSGMASCRSRNIRPWFWPRSLTMIRRGWHSMRTRSRGWFAIWATSTSSCCATMACSRSRRRSPMPSSICTSSRPLARSKCERKPAAS
jgi:Class II Aldolase and Adducin N-terminal domain